MLGPMAGFLNYAEIDPHQNAMLLERKRLVSVAVTSRIVDRDSSVGLATRYGLDGPGIESRWGRYFPHPSKSALGPTQPPI
jgi:hypothetical protein